jgi:hypothetical protein
MTMARAHLGDVAVTRWYHCITRCVRRAFLLSEGPFNRKGWIENRLKELAKIFAISVGGVSVLDNHLHVLVRLDPEVADGWSDEDVVRRWGRLFPPRDRLRQPVASHQGMGRVASPGRQVGGINPRAIAKPELVHEVLERTVVTAGKSPRQSSWRVFRGTV